MLLALHSAVHLPKWLIITMHAFYYGHSSLVFSHVHHHNLLVSLHVDQPDEDQLREHMMAGLTWQ